MTTEMSEFARTILNQKYAHTKEDGTQETWEEVSYRTAKNVLKAVKAPKTQIDKIAKLIFEKKFIPGGRYLYASGRGLHQVQNCFAGETRFVTVEGVKTLKDTVGTTQKVMTTYGEWKEAKIESFGIQSLKKVTIRRSGIDKELFATAKHSWRVADSVEKNTGRPIGKRKVLTEDLKPEDRLYHLFGRGVKRLRLSLAGVQHGLVFGDGGNPSESGDTHGFQSASIRLCGEKNLSLLSFFSGYETRKIEFDTEVVGLPRLYKDFPSRKSDHSYLYGWLAGYFAADGTVAKDGKVTLRSTNKDNLVFVKDICYLLGIGAYDIRKEERISNLTNEESTLYKVVLMGETLDKDFFLIEEHRRRFENNPTLKSRCTWRVVSVEDTERIEEVYCAVVPETEEFLLENNILVGNCALFRAEDSREGWADLMYKITITLMTGAGIGIDYSDVRAEGKTIRKTGGFATGPMALMGMVNEAGRGIVQGGSRRSAIWAGLRWSHPDVHKFIVGKNWPQEVRDLKAKDFNFPAFLDGTNISVLLDDEFFKAFHDEKDKMHAHAQSVYWATVKQMVKTAEPGFSVDVGQNAGETLRNAPVCADTLVLTEGGYTPVKSLIGKPTSLWTGRQWSPLSTFEKTSDTGRIVQVTMTGGRSIRCDVRHPFLVERYEGVGERRKLVSIDRVCAEDLEIGDIIHVSLPDALPNTKFDNDLYVLGYIYGDGSFGEAGNAEVTFCTEQSKNCIEPFRKHFLLSSINEEDGRGYKRAYFRVDSYWKDRSKDVFPVDVYYLSYNQAGSFLAGLFDADGNWEPTQNRFRLSSKHEGFLQNVSRLLEQYGILSHVSKAGHSTYGKAQTYQLVVASEYLERAVKFVPTLRLKATLDGYESYRNSLVKVISVVDDGIEPVYCADVKVDEHSFQAEGIIISNCTEITSRDDSDICNLGSINLSRINSLEEMRDVVECATAFLLAGTVYSDVPFAKIDQVRTKNRRLGLGLIGIHEWLLIHGHRYEPCDELAGYLEVYKESDAFAKKYADKWELSVPVKTRAIAPTGTIGILAETSTGCEPLFCVAYKRRYRKGSTWNYQYVIDPTAKRLIESGVKAENIEDAYTLAEDVERRVNFQAWLQQYVDHGISSTINLPPWGTEHNNEQTMQEFGRMLIKYLPKLRGITCYPDGARSGQPLTPVAYHTAIKHVGEVFVEAADICDITKGGTCGS